MFGTVFVACDFHIAALSLKAIKKTLNFSHFSGTVKWAPSCYLSRDDLMVLEDLKVASYLTLPRHVDFAINHTKAALRSLAAFHASNIIYERLELRPRGSSIGDTFKDMLFETSYRKDVPWCMTGMRALKAVALHKTKYGFGSSFEKAIEGKFMERVCEMFERLESNDSVVPRVCCHRDLWRNNLMYRFANDDLSEPTDCLLIDFQICRYLPLTLDVMICILLPSQDHSIADECKRFYFEQLSHELIRYGVEINDLMTWRDFSDSCETFRLVPLLQQGMFWSLANIKEEVMLDFIATDEKGYLRACNDERDDFVLDNMDKDEFYRDSMVGTVERLIEYLFVHDGSGIEK